ncbi:MAG: F0F1 ATP synthase subunit delta [Desulfovibrio sp.]|nr:F0F1 ATP synthase subunit delta [Desulfovibrio sp.]
MIGNVVARRYARALFAIGKSKGVAELDKYGKDLSALKDAIDATPGLLKLFRNPIFDVSEKKTVADAVLVKLGVGEMVKNFVHLLADKGRLGELLQIHAVFMSMLDAEKGVVRGELVTAIKLNAAKQKAMKAKLESQVGKELVLNFSTDPSILGGVVLKVGDQVLDASLRAQLGILKENIRRGE